MARQLAVLVGGAVRRSELLRAATQGARQLCTVATPQSSTPHEPPAAERSDLSPLLHPHSSRRCVRSARTRRRAAWAETARGGGTQEGD